MSTLQDKMQSLPPTEREIVLRIIATSKSASEDDPLLSADLLWIAMRVVWGGATPRWQKQMLEILRAASRRDPSLAWVADKLSELWGVSA